MLVVFLCLLIFLFVNNSNILIHGATTGLMLWFYNIIPLLLPFMLISNILVSNIHITNESGSANKKALFSTLFLGLFCGYPIGAFTTKKCTSSDIYSIKIGNMLLPVCNNASPMFISGYVINTKLHNAISLPKAYMLIYIPYFLYILLSVIFYYHNTKETSISGSNISHTNHEIQKQNTNIMLEIVENISIIGVYIIICSIIMEFLNSAASLIPDYSTINSKFYIISNCVISSLEITRGIDILCSFSISANKIIALTLALTSFGGISSILQTIQVIKASGLSIKNYITVKILCSVFTYVLALIL